MSRILAIDWDGEEARYALGAVQKDRLVVLSAGAAAISEVAEAVAAAEAESESECSEPGSEVEGEEEENLDDQPVETVETSVAPMIPMVYEDEDEDEDEAPPADGGVVVSTVKKSKRESFKTSPLAQTLKKLLRERKVGSALVCYSAERGDVDVMHMTIPQTSETETPEIVFNQALRDSLTFNETQPLDYMPLGLSTTTKRSGGRKVAAVSIARDKLRRIRETLIGAGRAPSKIELREPSLAEFLRADFCGLKYEDPVLLVQELCDEVNLVLCAGKDVLYFRSFKLQADATPAYRAERIRDEVARTLVVGVDDLPENAEVNQAIYFTGEAKPRPVGVYDGDEESEDEQSSLVRYDEENASTAARLAILLDEAGVNIDFINPFRLPGVKIREAEPENPGRYASLIGMMLAERPQNRPAIDLLHPREKPKPPNYLLVFLLYFVLVGIVAYAAWIWNKGELKKLEAEVAELEKRRDELQAEVNGKRPLYSALASANSWWNVQGVNVLDELRDIAIRLPSSPDFIVQRLAYSGSSNGRPSFIISAKITNVELYNEFRTRMTRDGSHALTGPAPRPNVGDPGYRYMFEATIQCRRRPAATFMAALPREIQQMSANAPEYFVQQEREKEEREKEEREKFFARLTAVLDRTPSVLAYENPEPAEGEKSEGENSEAEGEKPEGEAESAEGAAPAEPREPTVEEDQAFLERLRQFRQELAEVEASATNALRQNQITREQFDAIGAQYKARLAELTAKFEEVSARLAKGLAARQAEEAAKQAAEAEAKRAEEAASAEAQAEPKAEEPKPEETKPEEAPAAQDGAGNAQAPQTREAYAAERLEYWRKTDGNNTAEQDQQLAATIRGYRQKIDAQMRQYQAQAQAGQLDRARFARLQGEYQREVVNVEARWNAGLERAKARQEGAQAQAAEAAPAEQAPAEPAPEAAPESAPAEPAPAPAEPAPEPAPAPAEPAPEPAPAPAEPAPEPAPAPAE
ncbi:MAG: hypothetical protein IJM30_08540 [Thermoguttaceae bacterium]|nr:hypothetical protein [Thermoguttaceae bacterium]